MNKQPPRRRRLTLLLAFAGITQVAGGFVACAQETRLAETWQHILPEQRCLDIRDPAELCHVPIPTSPRPQTVSDPQPNQPVEYLSLSQAINTGLANLDVVRVLNGVTANSTGRTIYEAAISNTQIDQARGAFDPNVSIGNSWNQQDQPFAITNGVTSAITGGVSENYALALGLSNRTRTGGVLNYSVLANESNPRTLSALNPSDSTASALRFTQPLLNGAGWEVNQIPIVLARINTERSYFDYKNSVQQHVRSVIAGYWGLVAARTELWARGQQVEQLTFANQRAIASQEAGLSNAGEVAQTRVALENFRANLIVSQANLLQREAAMRNVLGFPPNTGLQLVPVSPLIDERLEIDWDEILQLAEENRPDVIELKLVLEADQQLLLQARNSALPQLDGIAQYQWNGLEGTMPNGGFASSAPGQFTGWELGVNFSVPIGLRSARASLRSRQLIIQRDRINLQQSLHQASHNLAISLRNLDQFFEQYQRFRAVREAAKVNLDQQLELYRVGNIQFIVVLQAIVDWGNSVTSEAQSLVQYNSELAQLELETGTILESHGIAFFEERFGAIGPLGRFGEFKCYPKSQPPSGAIDRYGAGPEASEEFFELEDPASSVGDGEETGDATREDIGIDNDDWYDQDLREPSDKADGNPSEQPQSAAPNPETEAIGPNRVKRFMQAPVRAAKALSDLFR